MGFAKEQEIEFMDTQGRLDDIKESVDQVHWNDWEHQFISTISGDWKNLSANQQNKVHELYNKLHDELYPFQRAMECD